MKLIRVVAYLVLGPILFIGLVVVVDILLQANDYRSMKNWPDTQATVVSSSLEGPQRTTTGNWYRALVYYRYSVNGATYYEIARGFQQKNDGPRAMAEHYLEQYPVGKVFRTHFNPGKPSEALVDTNYSAGTVIFVPLAFGVFFCLVGGGGLLALWIWQPFRRTSIPALQSNPLAGEL